MIIIIEFKNKKEILKNNLFLINNLTYDEKYKIYLSNISNQRKFFLIVINNLMI